MAIFIKCFIHCLLLALVVDTIKLTFFNREVR